MISSKLNFISSPLMRMRRKKSNLRLWMMFYSFHCSRRSLHWLSIGMETVSFCIIYDDLFDCRVHIAMIKGQVMVNCNIMLKTKKHLKTKNASTNYCSVAYYGSVCQWCRDLSKQTPFFKQFGEHQRISSQISKQEANLVPIKICIRVWTRCICDR